MKRGKNSNRNFITHHIFKAIWLVFLINEIKTTNQMALKIKWGMKFLFDFFPPLINIYFSRWINVSPNSKFIPHHIFKAIWLVVLISFINTSNQMALKMWWVMKFLFEFFPPLIGIYLSDPTLLHTKDKKQIFPNLI